MFHCFKCGNSGDAIDLWAKATKKAPYDAAVDLCQSLGINLPLRCPTPSPREPVNNASQTGTMSLPHNEAST